MTFAVLMPMGAWHAAVGARHEALEDQLLESASAENAFAGGRVQPGALFDGRFRLKELLHSTKARAPRAEPRAANRSASALLEGGGPVPLPDYVKAQFSAAPEPEWLKTGSFGQTWLAVTNEGRQVAVKMFYWEEALLTKRLARESRNPDVKEDLEAAAVECEIAQELQKYAAQDKKGASRIMRCLEEHVTNSIRGSDDDVLYNVYEFCGKVPLSDWVLKQFKEDTLTLQSLQSVWEQLQEGLSYMTNPNHRDKFIHHDLKPPNIVVDDTLGYPLVKLIDFGGTSKAPQSAAYVSRWFPATIGYVPVEWWDPKLKNGYMSPWHSFDSFSAAAIFWEMITLHGTTRILSASCELRLMEKYDQIFAEKMREAGTPEAKEAANKLVNGQFNKKVEQLCNVKENGQELLRHLSGSSQEDLVWFAKKVLEHVYHWKKVHVQLKKERGFNYCDLNIVKEAEKMTTAKLMDEIRKMAPNRADILQYLVVDWQQVGGAYKKDLLTALRSGFDLEPKNRLLPSAFLHAYRIIPGAEVTPEDPNFSVKTICTNFLEVRCGAAQGFACGAEGSACVNGACLCHGGFCAVNGHCLLEDMVFEFHRLDGLNAVADPEKGFPIEGPGAKHLTAARLDQCEEQARAHHSYLYTFFSPDLQGRARDAGASGACVLLTHDFAAAHGRDRVESWIMDKKIDQGGVISGVSLYAYKREEQPRMQAQGRLQQKQMLPREKQEQPAGPSTPRVFQVVSKAKLDKQRRDADAEKLAQLRREDVNYKDMRRRAMRKELHYDPLLAQARPHGGPPNARPDKVAPKYQVVSMPKPKVQQEQRRIPINERTDLDFSHID
eukprot:CAMPEP_0168447668 /NCGR_PEP_ID=MMETSP0228-20121227/46704_1 /TAXON_ID=133427 /ORGANISM="Protoceratium reticulatum, Strain CCCM 535 (=CCMP 1889)" /LENGTH=832 /DNA_ID=CAMNT_0008462191 /DNA_START=88 /DNA_END=2586 /DNA_ORIENTATION=+